MRKVSEKQKKKNKAVSDIKKSLPNYCCICGAHGVDAAHDGNFQFTGIELDKDYYEAAKLRIQIHQRQQKLF